MSNAEGKAKPGSILHWSDRAIAPFFPGWAVRRAAARSRLRKAEATRKAFSAYYEAAAKTRETADWAYSSRSANQAIIPNTSALNGRARRAVESNWIAASTIGAYKRHLSGIGITAKANARNPNADPADRTLNPKDPYQIFNRRLDALWNYWSARPRLIDIEKRKGMTAIQRLMVGDMATVGQSMLLFAFDRSRVDEVALVLQLIETEQLETGRVTPRHAGAQVLGGIEIDPYGAALGYWINSKEHPLETWHTKPVYVPADRVCQFIDQARVRQVYGVTKLSPVMKKMWHLEMYDEYTMIRARVEACICAILVENKDANGPMTIGPEPTADEGTTDGRDAVVEQLEPGIIKRIQSNSGEDVKFLNPTTPGGDYDPFVTQQIGQSAAGAMMDFAVVAREYRRATYSSQREARLERYVEIGTLQLLMIEQVLQPTREEFVRVAILQGLLEPLPGYWTDPIVREQAVATEWKAPPKIGIDPAKDAVAAKLEFEMGLATLRDKLNERGLDWREVLQQIADEKQLAEDLGLEIPWLMGEAEEVVDESPEDSGDNGGGGGDEDDPNRRTRSQQARGRNGGNGHGRMPEYMAQIAARD